MKLVRTRNETRMRLPLTVAIGFTGHRSLANENACRQAVRAALQEWKAKVPGAVYGVSSVAAGGDLLFADTCLELGIPLRILLPLPAGDFRDDFDAATWALAEKVLAAALVVEVVGSRGSRPERYYECGIETVQQSQLLFALWDGGPSQGLGGTADVVRFAQDQGRPLVWINSATGKLQKLNENTAILGDRELEFLNDLPDPLMVKAAQSPLEVAQNWLLKVDENASRVAPQFRRLASIPILCTAAAAVLSGRAAFPGSSSLWLGAGTVLGLMAAALPFLMRLTHRQVVWTRIRTAAEVCRSCLALWRTPALYEVVGRETVPELGAVLTSLNFLKMADPRSRTATLEEFKQEYRGKRVQHQIAYFSGHSQRADAQIRGYKMVAYTSIFLGAALNFWILLNAHGFNHWIAEPWKPRLALTATGCFQVATVAVALLFVNDSQRRRDRYQDLHRMLGQWEKQLELAQTWPIALRVASLVEKALLAELIEWRSLIRHRQVPQK